MGIIIDVFANFFVVLFPRLKLRSSKQPMKTLTLIWTPSTFTTILISAYHLHLEQLEMKRVELTKKDVTTLTENFSNFKELKTLKLCFTTYISEPGREPRQVTYIFNLTML